MTHKEYHTKSKKVKKHRNRKIAKGLAIASAAFLTLGILSNKKHKVE